MKLRTLAGIVLPVLREPSVCEACGSPFTCGAKLNGCWCSEIKLSDETRADLKGRYQSCLCRECLEKFAAMESEHGGPSESFPSPFGIGTGRGPDSSPNLTPQSPPQRGGEENLNQIPATSPVDNAG